MTKLGVRTLPHAAAHVRPPEAELTAFRDVVYLRLAAANLW